MLKVIIKVLLTAGILYIAMCIFLYFIQERLIFFPEKLPQDYRFAFTQNFEELNIEMEDGILLNSVLFKIKNPKGLIFYLHGNAGSLRTWGEVAKTYTDMNYDLFMLDYRGYGKSEGKISGENQLVNDLQFVYEQLKKLYSEDDIVILGYSVGTGPAAKLALANQPRLLILQAPYFALTDIMKDNYPFVPTFILKYQFETGEAVQKCKMPVVIFHGNKDEITPYSSALRFEKVFKSTDTLITLHDQGHNGITRNSEYLIEIQKILNSKNPDSGIVHAHEGVELSTH